MTVPEALHELQGAEEELAVCRGGCDYSERCACRYEAHVMSAMVALEQAIIEAEGASPATLRNREGGGK